MRKTILPIHNFWILVWLVFLAAQIAAAPIGNDTEKQEPVIHLTLKDAQDYAVKHAVETRNARLDIKESKKKIWETTAFGLPQITSTIGYQNMLKLPTTLIPAVIFDPDAPEDEFLELRGIHFAPKDISGLEEERFELGEGDFFRFHYMILSAIGLCEASGTSIKS